jgi:hypothetical protein
MIILYKINNGTRGNVAPTKTADDGNRTPGKNPKTRMNKDSPAFHEWLPVVAWWLPEQE